MYANSKKITAVLFLDYQYSMTVQIRCELTKLSQQNISNNNNFKIINQSVLSVNRLLYHQVKYVLTNKEASKHCSFVKYFGRGVVWGWSKYGTTRKNTQRYYTPKRVIRCFYPQLVSHQLKPNNPFSYSFQRSPCACKTYGSSVSLFFEKFVC